MRARSYLSTLVVLLAGATVSNVSAQDRDEEPERPWTLVYVMSYDNDLERHGTTILGELRRGVRDTPNAVAVLADDRDSGGLRRFALTGDATETSRIESDDSTSGAVLGEFLEWVAAELPARRYVITFLDHGGGQGEMCQDWAPALDAKPGWMSASDAASAIDRFRDDGRRDVALLFLQQCGRANLADLWAFRNAAPYLLASQTRMGAPNTYYEQVLRWLATEPGADGDDIARQIAAEDRHFATLALVDANAAALIPERMRPVADALRTHPDLSAPADLDTCYGGIRLVADTSYDVGQWTSRAAAGDADATAAAKALSDWIDQDLIVEHLRGPMPHEGSALWCGVSLFVPAAAAARPLHTDHPFDKATGLDALWTRLFGE